MFQLLKQRIQALLGLLPGENAKFASELLESARNVREAEYVLTESGIGVIPTELLAPPTTKKPTTFKVTAQQVERRSAPRTGSEAKRRRTMEPSSGSFIVVRKTSGRRRAAG